MLTELLVAVFSFLIFIYLYSQKRPPNYPPGPRFGFPLLGHFPFLGKEGHKRIFEWSRKHYGPIMSLNFGQVPVIVLNDIKIIKEALNDINFSGRPSELMEVIEDRNKGPVRGVLFTENQEWQEQRRFIIRNLRDFGFGKASMESLIQEEVGDLIETFRKKKGTPFSTHFLFNGPIINTLWRIMTGNKFKHDDPEFLENLRRLVSALPEANTLASLSIFIRPLRKSLAGFSGYRDMIKDTWNLSEFLKKSVITPHLESHIEGNARDFVDSYIDEIKKTTDPNSSFYSKVGESSLLCTLMDLFAAGAETSSTTLTWVLLIMGLYEDVQEKMAKEIEEVAGTRLPSLSDRPFMPYTEAVITEIMRFIPLVPFSIFHQTTKTVLFHGYTIPKNTLIIPNLYACAHDPNIWDKPEEFRPERFLSADGKTFKKSENFVAFSLGKRVCLGESLARDQIFLFVTGLFQNFHFKVDPSKPKPSLTPIVSTVLFPQPHTLILTER